jgi:DNA-binding response OmpR family regulator
MNVQLGTLRVAVIDDDSGFVHVLSKRLEGAGCQYRVLSGPVPAEELAAMKLNALVVEPSLLGPLAWEFLERVCGMLPGLGVIVCTQGATVAQRVRGLRLGADDWIAKPCHPEEVMARIEAVVRRHRRGQAREDTGPLVAGELEVRRDRFQAYVSGESLELTRREFELLEVLVSEAGKVLERDDLYRRVWGYAMIHGDRSVDVFVRKLRLKLQKRSPMWDYIHTHFGIGYRFDPQPVEPGADLAPGKARVMDEAELQDDEAPAAETAEPAISEKAASD